jgi:chromosome partitioning protein
MARKQQRKTTRVIVLGASKGGVGKTTLALALAVEAARSGDKVALLDIDPQASLWNWWQLRDDKTGNPAWIELGADHTAIGTAIAEGGFDWVFVDTPPGTLSVTETGIVHGDLVVVPCQPSPVDALAQGAVVELCRELGVAYVFAFNQVDPRGSVPLGVKSILAKFGEMLDASVCRRAVYQNAFAYGKSGPEMDGRDGKAKAEIAALWGEIRGRVLKGSK